MLVLEIILVKNGYFGKQILIILVVQVVRCNGHFDQLTVILVVDLTAISVIILFRRIERFSYRKLYKSEIRWKQAE